jgi:hypothetical protein
MRLELHFRIVGAVLVALALLHIYFPSHFKWRDELRAVSPLTRQIFFVHTFFIALFVLLCGLLTLFYRAELLASTPLARAILAGLTLFWGARWVTQLFIYDRGLWRGDRFRTAAHIFFVILWSYCVLVYGAALAASLQ